MRKFVLFFLLLVLGTSYAQQSLEQKITAAMENVNAVGLSVAVVKKGKIIYQEAFGTKNLATGMPLQSSDMFRIASISKSFSATAIMQLVEQKRLTLDDDISDLIGFKVRNPKYPDTKITMRMMLSHTSSLNDSQGYFVLDVIHPDKNKDVAKCFNNYQPGTDYMYCNLNFNMIGTVIEKLSGERFDRYIAHHILKPLGLDGGFCVDSLDQSRFASLYEYSEGEFTEQPTAYHPRREVIANYVMGYTTPVFSPTGGMKMSAPDLARYMTMHMNYGKSGKKRIISRKSAKLMQTPVLAKSEYGFALHERHKIIPGKKLVGHTGSAYGLYSYMFFDPKEKFGVVAITNGRKDIIEESTLGVGFLPEITKLLYDELIK